MPQVVTIFPNVGKWPPALRAAPRLSRAFLLRLSTETFFVDVLRVSGGLGCLRDLGLGLSQGFLAQTPTLVARALRACI